jgi:hypothetical protein
MQYCTDNSVCDTKCGLYSIEPNDTSVVAMVSRSVCAIQYTYIDIKFRAP